MDDEDDDDDEEERGIFRYADGDEEGAIGLNKQTAKQWWKWLPVTVPLLVLALAFCFSTVEYRQLGARRCLVVSWLIKARILKKRVDTTGSQYRRRIKYTEGFL